MVNPTSEKILMEFDPDL